eukprot:CAMPEP_0117550566 /NCGR_PEP_ID=MMETSP0784-20121206/48747_1 /TAXON_ID=39447 /ORGANISM="" /LENGTH=162 /DNA_ID=CAMNT_0005347589 /DNA_START=32 /DNA_END=519 /DNA_ORIENTATION=+
MRITDQAKEGDAQPSVPASLPSCRRRQIGGCEWQNVLHKPLRDGVPPSGTTQGPAPMSLTTQSYLELSTLQLRQWGDKKAARGGAGAGISLLRALGLWLELVPTACAERTVNAPVAEAFVPRGSEKKSDLQGRGVFNRVAKFESFGAQLQGHPDLTLCSTIS